MRNLNFLIAALVLAAAPVWAGSLEDAASAYLLGDYVTAVRIWRPMAEGGDADAQYSLGLMYANGLGVSKDDHEAAYWFRKASDGRIAKAQNNLGLMYSTGRGVPKDDQQAAFWFREAAEQGLAKAQSNLGLMYESGRGVPKDGQQAYFWLLLASGGGDAGAALNRDLIGSRLTGDQRAAALADARKPHPPRPDSPPSATGRPDR